MREQLFGDVLIDMENLKSAHMPNTFEPEVHIYYKVGAPEVLEGEAATAFRAWAKGGEPKRPFWENCGGCVYVDAVTGGCKEALEPHMKACRDLTMAATPGGHQHEHTHSSIGGTSMHTHRSEIGEAFRSNCPACSRYEQCGLWWKGSLFRECCLEEAASAP